jgi:hypothetical protein
VKCIGNFGKKEIAQYEIRKAGALLPAFLFLLNFFNIKIIVLKIKFWKLFAINIYYTA